MVDTLISQESRTLYRQNIGHGLAVARTEKGLSQKEVGEAGIVRSNRLSQIELGKVPIPTEEFLALSDFYETTPDRMLGVGSGKSATTYSYKINQELGEMSAKELEMIYNLLHEYNKKKK